MDLDTLKEPLGEETHSALTEYVTGLQSALAKARDESINHRKSLKSRVESLEGENGLFREKLGLDPDFDINDLGDIKADTEAAKQFEAKVRRLERENGALRNQNQELESSYKGSKLETQLAKAMSKFDFVDPDFVSYYIKSNATWEDEEILVKHDDAQLPLSEAVATIAKQKPHLLKARGAGAGSGHPPGSGRSGGQGNTMTRQEFRALSPQDKMRLSKEGVKLVNE